LQDPPQSVRASTSLGSLAATIATPRRHAQSIHHWPPKRVSPHSIHRSAATDLLGTCADINTIRGWLCHVSLDTTNVYAEVDLQMKAKPLAKCDISKQSDPGKRWRDQPTLMEFLRSL
jgi:site-specific recombinase XerC